MKSLADRTKKVFSSAAELPGAKTATPKAGPQFSRRVPVTATTVCNVKVKHIRPEYANLKDWVSDSDNVYIGRAGVVFVDGVRFPSKASEWANPFAIGKDGDRASVLLKFEQYVTEKLDSNPALRERLMSLQKKRLGCWCVEKPTKCTGELICHGQILLGLIEKYSSRK